jgi:hypothetical protein
MNDHDKTMIKQFVEACKDLNNIDCNHSTMDLAVEIHNLEPDHNEFEVALSVIEDYTTLARAIIYDQKEREGA